MSTAGTADLQVIAQEMSELLEARIGELLGNVKAAREVTQQLLDVDGELNKALAARRRISALLSSLDDDPDAPEIMELRRKLDGVAVRVKKLEGRYDELLDRLNNLKSNLDA